MKFRSVSRYWTRYSQVRYVPSVVLEVAEAVLAEQQHHDFGDGLLLEDAAVAPLSEEYCNWS